MGHAITDEMLKQAGITGWSKYNDSLYTSLNPFLLTDGVEVTLPNNSCIIDCSQKPSDISDFYYAGRIDIINVVGTFEVGELITGGISGAMATISVVDPTYLLLNAIDGAVFMDTESISGGLSGAVADVTGTQQDGALTGNLGDAIDFQIELIAVPLSIDSNISLVVGIDVGLADNIFIGETHLRKGVNEEHYFLNIRDLYIGSDFSTNNGTVKIYSINSNVNIYDIKYLPSRKHKANV